MLKYCQWIFWRRYEKEIANVKNSPIFLVNNKISREDITKEFKFGIGKNEKNKITSTMRKGNMKVTRSKPSKGVPFLFNGYCYKIN